MLEVTGLSVAYGGIRAVRSITFHVAEGETVALIGANGAGKTSTLKALARLLDPAGGCVRFLGEDLTRLAPHRLVEKGIALVPEGRGVFPRLSVAENLAMGAFVRRDRAAVAADSERIYDLFPRLRERAGQLAGTLSGGEQQMLAVGRAIMTSPKLLMMDEPSLGLAPLVVKMIFEIVKEINKAGVTVLLIEQNAKAALEIADFAYVLETGRLTMSGPGRELLADDGVRKAYLGEG